MKWRAALASAWLCLLVACSGGGGDGKDENQAPRTALVASGDVRADGAELQLTLGGVVKLDASASVDPDAQALSYEWTLTSRPAESTAAFAGGNEAVLEWTPDAMGAYTFALKVTDSEGASATQSVTVTVNNRAPQSSLVVTPQFTVVPSIAPTQAVTVGAVVLVDASSSVDPDGDAVSVSFELAEKPAQSQASLVVTDKSARLATDVQGVFKIRVIGRDGRGAEFESVYTFDADNRVPNPVVVTDVTAVVADAGSNIVQASVGYDVVLSGAASTDPDGNALTRAWILKSKPAGSTVSLSSAAGATTSLSPDVLGDFVVLLTVTDSVGAKSQYTTTVRVDNRRPSANIGTNAIPQSLPSAPSVTVPPGTKLTLRGSLSDDADGDALNYQWSIVAKPAGSTAALSSATAADPSITLDVEGQYQFRLRVTDVHGAYSQRLITVNAGTHTPVAVVDKNRVAVLPGTQVTMSAALSYDEDGDALTYEWSLDAKPAGSAVTIAGATGTSLSVTPDVAGTYVVALTARDARSSSVAYVTIRALEQIKTSVQLSFVPTEGKYSRGLDKLVLGGSGTSLRIVDPFIGSIQTVALPAAISDFQLSPDGKLAIVLHSASVSLVDLDTATVVHTTPLAGAMHYERAQILDDGTAFLTGTSDAWWAETDTLNARTGEMGSQHDVSYYDAAHGVLADRIQRVFMVSRMSSPSDLKYFEYNASHEITGWSDSPYHGDYDMSPSLFLSEQQDLLFTAQGDYYRTDTLAHAGVLVGGDYLRSLSHSATEDELLTLPYGGGTYAAAYKRYTGATFTAAADMPMPMVNGQQGYAMQIFHSAAGSHVILTQTGSATPGAGGVQFYVITR